jgi:hypothetical protein
MPRSLLSQIGKWCQQKSQNDENEFDEMKLNCLNISNNRFLEIEGALFTHLGADICQ